MEIINVVEIVNGILTSIESYLITSDDDYRSEQVVKAEENFMNKASANGCDSPGDMIEEGGWDDNNGYNVMIHWSNVNN